MNCASAAALLDAYLDNELDVSHVIDVEQHLRECADCSQALKSARILSRSLRNLRSSEAQAPEQMRKAAVARLRRVNGAGRRRWVLWGMIPAAASLVAIGVFNGPLMHSASDKEIAREVTASHIRSLMPNHLLDVTSSDRHTVKPWFAGKIDYSPPVSDFGAEGFPLVGGRLDYIGSRQVAVLIYERRQHAINCYVWPENGEDSGVAERTENGYQMEDWRKAGMRFWLVSDLNGVEMRELAKLMQEH